MESAQALAVVRSLANGVDPESGEVFPPNIMHPRQSGLTRNGTIEQREHRIFSAFPRYGASIPKSGQ